MSNPPIGWKPNPGGQFSLLTCPVFEALLEGDRGGGKTEVFLADFTQHVGPKRHELHRAGYGAAWRGIVFRRTYPELEDIIAKSEKLIGRLFPDAKLVMGATPEWRFGTGEVLMFRQLNRLSDYRKYHGWEVPWLGFEELTTWPTDELYRQMMSICRSGVPGMPEKVRATTNPSGPGHNWVRRRFGLPIFHGRHRGPVIRRVGEKERVAIRCLRRENPNLQAGYEDTLRTAASSHAQLQAWLHGRWDIMAGGMFDDVWDYATHVVPDFPVHAIPRSWKIDRAYDHGSSKPFSVGWWAESSGEPFEWGDRVMGTVRGDLFLIYEWYGSPDHTNTGLKLTAREIGDGIVDREQDFGLWGIVRPGPADTQIFHSEPGVPSVASEFQKVGVQFTEADKGPGSRKQGWEVMRQMFKGAMPPPGGYREDPGLFICERCVDAREKIPSLPRKQDDQDDVDTESEDHIGDMARYRVRRKQVSGAGGSWR